LIGITMFAGTLPAARLAVMSLDPVFLTGGRVAIGGLAGLLLLVALQRPLRPGPRSPTSGCSASSSDSSCGTRDWPSAASRE
jgi:hypothetical protein